MSRPTQLTPRTSVTASEQLLMAALLLPVLMLSADLGVAGVVAAVIAVLGLLAGVGRAGQSVRGSERGGLGILQRLCTLLAWGVVLVAALTGATVTLSATGAGLAAGIALAVLIVALVLIEVLRSGSWVLDSLTARRERS